MMLPDRRRCFREDRRDDVSTEALVTDGGPVELTPNPPTAAMPDSE